jgi:hypothetical protein
MTYLSISDRDVGSTNPCAANLQRVSLCAYVDGKRSMGFLTTRMSRMFCVGCRGADCCERCGGDLTACSQMAYTFLLLSVFATGGLLVIASCRKTAAHYQKMFGGPLAAKIRQLLRLHHRDSSTHNVR